jgi:hypothetical protein
MGIANERIIPMMADHRAMCRFSSRTSQRYKPVERAILDITARASGSEAKPVASLEDLFHSTQDSSSWLPSQSTSGKSLPTLSHESSFTSPVASSKAPISPFITASQTASSLISSFTSSVAPPGIPASEPFIGVSQTYRMNRAFPEDLSRDIYARTPTESSFDDDQGLVPVLPKSSTMLMTVKGLQSGLANQFRGKDVSEVTLDLPSDTEVGNLSAVLIAKVK